MKNNNLFLYIIYIFLVNTWFGFFPINRIFKIPKRFLHDKTLFYNTIIITDIIIIHIFYSIFPCLPIHIEITIMISGSKNYLFIDLIFIQCFK